MGVLVESFDVGLKSKSASIPPAPPQGKSLDPLVLKFQSASIPPAPPQGKSLDSFALAESLFDSLASLMPKVGTRRDRGLSSCRSPVGGITVESTLDIPNVDPTVGAMLIDAPNPDAPSGGGRTPPACSGVSTFLIEPILS